MKGKDGGLGRSIVKSRQGKSTGKNTSQLHQIVTADGHEWLKLGSVTEQNDLDDLMAVAELSGKEFTAERGSVSVITTGGQRFEDRVVSVPHDEESLNWIRIPRRPSWDTETSREELHQREQESFLEWRRQLARIEESDHFILTPFERNLDIWRQLWRVTELSDVIVQIVDARNPEVFFCSDLITYAQSLDKSKRSLLLINKADLLTQEQRELWADHFHSKSIDFIFFSALAEEPEEATEDIPVDSELVTGLSKVFSRAELLAFFGKKCQGSTIGLVGYPNVGKSSTINCLMGEKKVAVALTPGKTKHFQTLLLGNGVKICDCPGLVFPNFAMSKSELVLNGILPVDQLKDWQSPVALLAERIPRDIIERLYGITLPLPGPEEDPHRSPNAQEILSTFAIARGFRTSNYGNPDQSRASRIILKDYIAGKLLYCYAPPKVDPATFSLETLRVLREQLPIRSHPKPHKPMNEHEDVHLMESTAGFVTRKPGEKAIFSKSKKHYKGKK